MLGYPPCCDPVPWIQPRVSEARPFKRMIAMQGPLHTLTCMATACRYDLLIPAWHYWERVITIPTTLAGCRSSTAAKVTVALKHSTHHAHSSIGMPQAAAGEEVARGNPGCME